MTNWRVLTPNENLEDFRSRLEGAINRPVFICSALPKNGTHHILPTGEVVSDLTPLDLYLSTFTDNSLCVRRNDYEDKASDYYFRLEESGTLYLVYPYTKGDDPFYPDFPKVNLNGSFRVSHVRVSESEEEVPHSLKPYVSTRKANTREPRVKGVSFHVSQPFQAPKETRTTWHFGLKPEKEGFKVLQPPGKYSFDFKTVEMFSTFGLISLAPGPCVVCRGAKGEKMHFVALHASETGPMGHICRGCARDTFDQWLKLMGD